MDTELVTKDHFTDLRTQITQIKKDNESIVFDYETQDKEARSHVATLRKSKTAINNLHKEKKAYFLAEGRKIDAGKNELIADVEEMIAVHAEPLQVIKDRKDAEVELERKKVEMELDWDDALQIDDLFNRERAMAIKEAEIAQMEADRIAKEKAEQDKKDKIAYEAKVKKEADERAVRDAEEALLFHEEEKERLIEEAKQKEAQAKIDAENAEKKRLADIQVEKDLAEQEKQDYIAQQKRDHEESERLLADKLAKEKVTADRKAANMNHRKAVNNKVLKKLISIDVAITDKIGKKIIEDILKNPAIEITINY